MFSRQNKSGLIGEGTIDIRGASLLSFSFDLPNSQTERLRVYLPSRSDMPVYTNILYDQRSAFYTSTRQTVDGLDSGQFQCIRPKGRSTLNCWNIWRPSNRDCLTFAYYHSQAT